jgi:magnesium chelatase family protein
MVAHINTIAFEGISITDVEVQVHIAAGLPSFTIVGLPDKAVAESRERVRVAIQALGLALPAKRITVNLAPADIAKEGSHFDVPIALGLLVAMDIIPQDAVSAHLVLGELSLDGRILPVSGVLPTAMGATERDFGIICPAQNAQEARWAGDISILAPASLIALINHFKGKQLLSSPEPNAPSAPVAQVDLSQVKGQHHAKRALEIAAAGGHNLLMNGPPGTGKSMLASCMPAILPEMSVKERLDISVIASVAGILPEGGLVQERPYRAPHHSASLPAMVGGGKRAKPGEISLAHRGILFLDELPEFPRAVLEALRQPLETRTVSISRAHAHVTYPADFQLIAAMNPCKCGYLADASRACSKAPRCGQDYQGKISGPMLDRFDLHVDVPMLSAQDMFSVAKEEDSATVAARVQQARHKQEQRYQQHGFLTNSHAPLEVIETYLPWDAQAKTMLEQAAQKLGLSMRGITRLSRVAATIADLLQHNRISSQAIAEALSYRYLPADSPRRIA